MPFVTLPDGSIARIPGVYFSTQIASSTPGPLPAFLVPVILGSSFEGHPYNADATAQVGEPKPSPFLFCGTADAAARYYGRGSDIHRAMVWAQRHGLPGAYLASLSALTRASVIADASSVNQATVVAKKWGAPGGWIKVSYAASVLTVQGLKNYAILKSNLSSTATRIELKGDTDWIVEGMVLAIGDNTVAIGSVTVKSKGTDYDASGLPFTFIETVSAFGTAVTIANYAMVAQYDVGNEEVIAAANAQALIDGINKSSQLLHAAKHSAFTNAVPDTIASLTPIKQIVAWVTATAGTSPAATSSDVTAWISLMNASQLTEFLKRTQKKPRSYLLAMGDSASHGLMRDYALNERQRGMPISLDTGGRWGDVVINAGDDTDPLHRTQALNSQDVALWGPGLDYEPPYLSMAGAVFGRRVSGGPNHNLTNDELLFSVLEKQWDEINSAQLTLLCQGGFGTVKLSLGRTFRYRICEGINTLQANAVVWNPTTKDTWSIMVRDNADYVNWVQQVDLEEDQIGADGVNPNTLSIVLRQRADKFLIPRGNITPDYKITLIQPPGNAGVWTIKQQYSVPSPSDFIQLENTILV